VTIRPTPVFHQALILFLIAALTACANTPTPTGAPGPVSTRTSAKDGMAQVYVPAGEFLMGSTSADIDQVMQACTYCQRDWFKDEMPQHKVIPGRFLD
jgi:formylglycine-generating enzyme required for sulfatase activity